MNGRPLLIRWWRSALALTVTVLTLPAMLLAHWLTVRSGGRDLPAWVYIACWAGCLAVVAMAVVKAIRDGRRDR